MLIKKTGLLTKKNLFILLIVLFVLYSFQLWRVAHNYSQSFRFGDEDSHMAGGYLLLKGYKLYEDFSVNHQPSVYFFSAFVQKIFSPNTLYTFIGRHREMIFLYSYMWNLLLIYIFGPIMILFTLIFEICKYWMLGNKVLSDPLAVYPLVLCFGIFTKKFLFNKPLKSLEMFLFSLSSFIVAFSLLPLWPSLFIMNIFLLVSVKKNKQLIIWQFIPLFLLSFIMFIFVPFFDYVKETIIYNYQYLLPTITRVRGIKGQLQIFFVPFTAFHSKPNNIEVAVWFFLVVYSLLTLIFIRTKKFVRWIIILITIALSNNRMATVVYGNFHMLPWLGSFFAVPILSFIFLINEIKKNPYFRLFLYIIGVLFICVAVWLNFFGRVLFNINNNLATEHHINYSDSVKYGLGIKAVKKPGDRVLAIPNDMLVFWVSNTDLAVRPLESYHWQYLIPEYKIEVEKVIFDNPPEFILVHDSGLNTNLGQRFFPEGLVMSRLKQDYVQINHLGKPSHLFIQKKRVESITDIQWKEFNYFLFEKPVI